MKGGLELAEIRLVRVRQELQTKFGNYDELRQTTIGLLQALDLRIVHTNLLRNISEQLMVTIPRYWLAPVLVALVAWINDQKEIADRALKEALRRNEKKTALFFALVCRRYKRYQASKAWFEHYFETQDPMALDPEFVTLLEGMTNGVFALNVRMEFQKALAKWIAKCTDQHQLSENERTAWKKELSIYLRSQIGTMRDKYPYLRKMTADWKSICKAIEQHQYFSEITSVMQNCIEKKDIPPSKVEEAVDQLIERLIEEAEGEERELKKEERKLELIIECNGDWTAGEERFRREKAQNDQSYQILSFIRSQILQPNPNISPATQKYCLALAKKWILEAHEDITATIRAQVPNPVRLKPPGKPLQWGPIDRWTYEIRDGSEELEAEKSLLACLKKSMDFMIKKRTKKTWKDLIEQRFLIRAAVYLSIIWLGWYLFPFAGVFPVAAIIYYRRWRKVSPIRQRKIAYEKHAIGTLKAGFADFVDWRREIKQADRKACDLSKLLNGLKAEEMLTAKYDTNRIVL